MWQCVLQNIKRKFLEWYGFNSKNYYKYSVRDLSFWINPYSHNVLNRRPLQRKIIYGNVQTASIHLWYCIFVIAFKVENMIRVHKYLTVNNFKHSMNSSLVPKRERERESYTDTCTVPSIILPLFATTEIVNMYVTERVKFHKLWKLYFSNNSMEQRN